LQPKHVLMAAYCFFDIREIRDEQAMQEYREKVLHTVDQFDGRYVVIGGPFSVKEGSQSPVFPVMIEFPSMEKAEAWYDSPDYIKLKTKRLQAVESEAVFFQGL